MRFWSCLHLLSSSSKDDLDSISLTWTDAKTQYKIVASSNSAVVYNIRQQHDNCTERRKIIETYQSKCLEQLDKSLFKADVKSIRICITRQSHKIINLTNSTTLWLQKTFEDVN